MHDAAGIEEEESGWKYIHGDVFRFPPHKNLFCAFVGTGTQVRCHSLYRCALPSSNSQRTWQPAVQGADKWPLLLQLFWLMLFIFLLAFCGSFYPYNR